MKDFALLLGLSSTLCLFGCGSTVDTSLFDQTPGVTNDAGNIQNDVGSVNPKPDAANSTPDSTLPPVDVGVDPVKDVGVDPVKDTGKPVSCTEPNSLSFNGHCYFTTESLRWDSARQACEKTGAHLVVINNQQEAQALINFYASERWIGLSRPQPSPAEEKQYKWVNGDPSTFRIWAQNEPNFSSPNNSQAHCARTLTGAQAGRWGDLNCETSLRGICERE